MREVTLPTVLGLLFLTVVTPKANAITPFVIESIDNQGFSNVGLGPSIDIDAHGSLHVSYYDAQFDDLRYAIRRSDVWSLETIDRGGDVGMGSSIRVAPDGTVHISYLDFTNNDLKYARGRYGEWLIEIVDDVGDVGFDSAIALDRAGIPHISYYDFTNGNLKYAQRAEAGGLWFTETAHASVDDVGRFTSIEVTSAGDPVISYEDFTNRDLWLARKEEFSWVRELVDPGAPSTGDFSSLELDSQGNPHIAYSGIGELRYAFWDDSSWSIETVDVGGFLKDCELALTDNGTAMISYAWGTNPDLKFARRSGGVWETQTVDASGLIENGTSIDVDAEGTPYIPYHHFHLVGPGDLRLADASLRLEEPAPGALWAAGSQQIVRWKGGGAVDVELSPDGGGSFIKLASQVGGNVAQIQVPSWATENSLVRLVRSNPPATGLSARFFIGEGAVDPWWSEEVIGGHAEFSSIALDTENRPRVSHDAFDQLYYSERVGHTWVHEIVDTKFGMDIHSSLALDQLGNPHIAYEDEGDGDLEYATRVGGIWNLETVDSAGAVGIHPSLVLDAVGIPHISYRDDSNNQLKYATRVGGLWMHEAVDNTNDVGTHSSIAVGKDGEVHITYFDIPKQILRYARGRPGGWTIGAVDDFSGFIGAGSSIVLDETGTPHVAYLRQVDLNQQVFFATLEDGVWHRQLASSRPAGTSPSLRLTPQGEPRIAFFDGSTTDLYYLERISGRWKETLLLSEPFVAVTPSLAIDDDGRAHVSSVDHITQKMFYLSEALQIDDPNPGASWPVGSGRTITWDGTGIADVYLSLNAGESWEILENRVSRGAHRLTVPHAPTRFAKLKLLREVPFSEAITESLFTIETEIQLLLLNAETLETGGARISWDTRPGPEDLSGYRLERAMGARWETLIQLTRELSAFDPSGGPGSRYRLFGVNGLGNEVLLGSVRLTPSAPLAAWPLPYRGGPLSVSFSVFGRLGEARGEAEVLLFDVAGRMIATLARGRFEGPQQQVTWEGRDDEGRRVSPGVYFLRARSAGVTHQLKLTVLQ